MSACSLCSIGYVDQPEKTHVEVARENGIGESSVRRHRKNCVGLKTSAAVPGMTLKGATIREADGSWYRYVASGPVDEIEDFDVTEILNRLDRTPRTPQSGPGAFVISLNDWQYGKAEGGGSRATAERIKTSVAKAKHRIAELRSIGRELGTLVIIGGGDILEGCVIYPNQAFNLDLHRHDQIVGSVELVLYVIDQLSGLFDNTKLLVAKGNHGENRIDGKKTHAGDNDDTLIFKMARQACDRDPALKHLEWVIAEGAQEAVSIEVCGWRLGTTHGDVFGKSPGSNAKKAWEWFKNMRAGGFDIGEVDVLISHHFHHEESADWGKTYWRQTRAQDGGSAYFEAMSGQYSESGMLSFVMTPDRRYQDCEDL